MTVSCSDFFAGIQLFSSLVVYCETRSCFGFSKQRKRWSEGVLIKALARNCRK